MFKRLLRNIVVLNSIYLILIQFVNYVFPLVTIPYLVRNIGVGNYGLIVFSQVVLGYLTIIVDYGFNISATREISLCSGDKRKVSNIFWNVLVIKVALCLLLLLLSFVIISSLNVDSLTKKVYLINIFSLIGITVFPVWLYQGLQKMKYISFFNFLAKLIITIPIFIFVHSPNDVVLTSWINFFGALLPGLFSIFYAIKKFNIMFVSVSKSQIYVSLTSGFDIFLPNLLSSITANGGIFVLGLASSKEVLGIYASVDKIVKAGVAMLDSIAQSLFPNVAQKFSTDPRIAISTIKHVCKYVVGALIVFTVILWPLSGYLLSLFYTIEYRELGYIFNYLMIWAILHTLNKFVGIQYMVGSGNARYYKKAFILTSIVTLASFFLIFQLEIAGVLLTSIIGELLILLACFYFIIFKITVKPARHG